MIKALQISAVVFLLVFFQKVGYTQIDNENEQSNNNKLLNNLKISGYVQADYQVADSVGAPMHFAGGDFGSRFTDKRFAVRRGRINLLHDTHLSKASLSFDLTERGIGVRDANLKLSVPYLPPLSITAGIFYRPFGHDLSYSSSLRETPERARVHQTLFPHERDLGASIRFQPADTCFLHFLMLEAGFFNGNAINVETDKFKDFIGRVHIKNPIASEKIKFGLGFSYYNGAINHIFEPIDTSSFNQQDKYNIFVMAKDDKGNKFFEIDSAATLAAGNMGGKVLREYYGIDAQLSIDFPFGKMEFRGEYLWGTQPAAFSSRTIDNIAMYQYMNSFSPTGPGMGVSYSTYQTPTATYPYIISRKYRHHHTFVRKFDGGSLYLIQNIFDTKHQFVFKYDWYNPNTEVSGKDIDLFFRDDNGEALLDLGGNEMLTYLSPADISYKTYGIGWNYQYSDNVRIMLYYDMIINEITNIEPYEGNISQGKLPSTGFRKDVKDNVFTVRLQYKF